jgi:hypothetical protein
MAEAANRHPDQPLKKGCDHGLAAGGLSHLDSYARSQKLAAQTRGPFKTIPAKVPGLHFTELMPRQASIADKMVVLRSMRQTAGGHPAGSMQLLSGDPDTRDKPKPKYPDWMTISDYLLYKRPSAEPFAMLCWHQPAP